jgi:diaminohydroxyphosphoribosylaminopyrimidine deaminase/5-amino-6-(5-phosphoribosylamino)uracil reductase
VHVKVAQTLDGKIGRLSGHTIVISSRESRAMVHRWRSQYDAVVVGAGTVLADDPALTVRLVEGRNPKAVVLDGAFRVSLNSRLFHPRTRRQGFICVSELAAARHARKISAAEGRGITVLKFPGINDRLRLNSVLREVYRRGIGSLLVEGGSGIFGAFAAGGVIDELSIFIAPDILGEGVTAFGDPPASRRLLRRASSITVTKSGGDVLLQARFS